MTEFSLDHWLDLYASRTASMRSSEVRELLAVTARPDMISFAGGLPDTRLFPADEIVKATKKIMKSEGHAALQYGPSEGHLGLKKELRALMKEEDIDSHLEDFIVTDGAQQALDLIAKVFIDRGEPIIIEAPCYIGALQAFAGYQPRFVSVPLDDEGMRIDLLKERLVDLKKEGVRPKFLYTVPNFHNPVGVTLSKERRLKLLEVAKDADLLVVEDNPYGLLRYEGDSLPLLRGLDSEVIYISTLSKIFSPGIRLGWVLAPPPILEKIIFAKQAANLCSGSFAQRVAEEYLRAGLWKKHIKRQIEVYQRRRDTMLDALDEFFPPRSHWTKPQGGIFLWATLPEYLDTTEMLAEAIQQEKVAYVPGKAFFAGDDGNNQMRLNFSHSPEEVLKKGIKRLAKVVKKQMELYPYIARGLEFGRLGDERPSAPAAAGRQKKGKGSSDGSAAKKKSKVVGEKKRSQAGPARQRPKGAKLKPKGKGKSAKGDDESVTA